MAAKKKNPRSARPAKKAPLSPKVARRLDEAEALARRGQWGEADALLRTLAREYPRQPDILTAWMSLARRFQDYRTYLEACDRLIALRPDDPTLRLARAGAYLSDEWPALRAFREFVERWPNHPDAEQARQMIAELEPRFREDLADVYQRQGRHEESRRLVREIHTRHPDYWFGRVGVARQAIADGRLEEAQEILRPMLERTRLHASEFAALATTEVQLQLARGQVAGAQTWLDMFKRMLPEHPNLVALRRMIRDAGRKGPPDDLLP